MTTPTPGSPARQYYEGFRAARDRLERVSLGIEQLALEVATVKGHPTLGRHMQDRIRQLLCVHPEGSLRYGAAQTWCSICFKRLEPGELDERSREIMAHVVIWCKCDTRGCPVHNEGKEELPSHPMVIPAIPEARRAPELSPVVDLIDFSSKQEEDHG